MDAYDFHKYIQNKKEKAAKIKQKRAIEAEIQQLEERINAGSDTAAADDKRLRTLKEKLIA